MRINLWAGPGAGKSSLASVIFASLKKDGFVVELITEYIKKWAYQKKNTSSFDQLYVFAKQLNSEDLILRNGVEHVISDSPILMQTYYAKKYNFPCVDSLVQIANAFEKKFPSLNIFLNREGVEYQELGRYENYQEAIEADAKIYEFACDFLGKENIHIFKTINHNEIVDFVKNKIEKEAEKNVKS